MVNEKNTRYIQNNVKKSKKIDVNLLRHCPKQRNQQIYQKSGSKLFRGRGI